MRRVYNQKNMSLTIDGVNIQDFHEGATFVYTWDGGEVDKTQGTDGAGINIAANQGATLQFTLRETSRSIKFLSDLRLRQENGGAGVTMVARTGADILLTMTEGYISRPGQLSTGDKKQGSMQFTITSADDETANLSLLPSSFFPRCSNTPQTGAFP